MLALSLALVASLVLAACGSSSSSTTTATSASAKTSAKGPARFTALRECLKKEGIELPARKAGQTGKPGTGGPGGFFGGGTPGGGLTLPKGVTKAQYEAAIKKCGGGFRRGNFAGGFGARVSSASYKKALASFVKCMSSNGIKLPTPNTSGKGPVFDTSKVDVNTTQFKTADAKCASLLRFARPGAGAAGANGGPPEGAGTPPTGEGAPPAGEGTAPGA